jgi:predicted hotdog family 3-hydroxylacyl-ACP dehydratase
MNFPVEDITALIPQKQPFVMVSKLLYANETITRSSFIIHPDNVFVKDGFFQEAGLMENIAQTAALGEGYKADKENKAIKSGYIASVKNFEVIKLPQVNDELITEVHLQDQVFNIIVLHGKIWLKDILIASCEMKVLQEIKERNE